MSRGPSIPVKCSTIELKDLADTLDFDKEGKERSEERRVGKECLE